MQISVIYGYFKSKYCLLQALSPGIYLKPHSLPGVKSTLLLWSNKNLATPPILVKLETVVGMEGGGASIYVVWCLFLKKDSSYEAN